MRLRSWRRPLEQPSHDRLSTTRLLPQAIHRPAATLPPVRRDRYTWIALSNTTLGVLMATIDSSIMLIALPDIFRGIGIDPLRPETVFTCSG